MATQCTTQTQTADMADNDSSSPPQLSFQIATSEDERIDALRLVADSIAQQRQAASQAVIFHPLCLASLAAISLLTWRLQPNADLAGTIILQSGLVITYLAAVQYYTAGYIQRAESFNWKSWITAPDGKDDAVFVAQFGSELIGALVLRLTAPGSKDAKKGRGEIRAWTTKLRYRNRGIGGDLLRQAARYSYETLGSEANVEFAVAHSNAPLEKQAMFNGGFVRREERARRALRDVVHFIRV